MSSITITEHNRLLPEFSLEGKVIVVTGGARGLGLTQADVLIEAGAIVHVLDVLPAPSSDFSRICSKATTLGTSLTYHIADVRSPSSLSDTISRIGKIDGLIAAAGVQKETPALLYSAPDANAMLEVNVTGVFLTAQAVAREMIARKTTGSIVLVASMSGRIANKGLLCPIYNASKAAVAQLARNLAAEWGNSGIRVNSLSPGYIMTDMVEKLLVQNPERKEEWASQNMLGRLSSPAEYRGAAVFLLSDASSFMTGADLVIDGGHSAW